MEKVSAGKSPIKSVEASFENREEFRDFLVDMASNKSSVEELREIYKNCGFLEEDIESIESGKWWEKAGALVRLKRIKSEKAEKEAFQILNEERVEVRLASLDYLSGIDSPKLIGELEEIFERNSENLDQFLIIRLFDTNLDVESLKSLSESSKIRFRRISAILSGEFENGEAYSFLKTLSNDEDERVRVEVARSIGRIGSRDYIPILSDLKDDESHKVRADVAKSLGRIESSKGLELLEELAEDPVRIVRLRSFLALSKFGEVGREIIEKHSNEYPDATQEAMLRSFYRSG